MRQEAAKQEAGRREAARLDGLREASKLAAGRSQTDSILASPTGGGSATSKVTSTAATGAGAGASPSAVAGSSNGSTGQNANQGASTSNKPLAALIETPTPIKPTEKKTLALPDNSRLLTLLGRKERDARIQMFQESWRQKVEQNAPFELLQAAQTGSFSNPLVTVSLRQDGSVESVVINRSSGISALDNAVKRIVQMLAPFDPIPRELAMDYDAVEIVRVWSIGDGLRLVYGGR